MARAFRTVLKHFKDSRGVSLYEITAAVAMTGILAAVAVPIVLDRVEDAKVARSGLETDTIAKAMEAFKRDTGVYPGELEKLILLVSDPNSSTLTDAVTPSIGALKLTCTPFVAGTPAVGGTPAVASTGNCADMNTFLVTKPGDTGYTNWRGPYMDPIIKDQFGRAYTVNVRPLYLAEAGAQNTTGFGWVLSAGADRTLQANLTDTKLSDTSDDIGKNLGKKVTLSVR
jgi:type II secretory pathway pseudopilin PulG